MIVKITKAIYIGVLWNRACKLASCGDISSSLKQLDKIAALSKGSYKDLLLRGYLEYASGNYEKAIESMNKSIGRVDESKRLNDDEKLYLKSYAIDIMNFSIVRDCQGSVVTPTYLEFDIRNVSEELRRLFPVLLDRG